MMVSQQQNDYFADGSVRDEVVLLIVLSKCFSTKLNMTSIPIGSGR